MGKTIKAFTDNALETIDAIGIEEAIATGKISTEEVNDALNAQIGMTNN